MKTKTTHEISRSIRETIQKAMDVVKEREWDEFPTEYLHCNITVHPGEFPVFTESGCNGAEMLRLLDEFDRCACKGVKNEQ